MEESWLSSMSHNKPMRGHKASTEPQVIMDYDISHQQCMSHIMDALLKSNELIQISLHT